MSEEYIFQLSENLTYSKDGKFVETAEIAFMPPNMESFDESAAFSQLMTGALMSAGDSITSDAKALIEAKKDEEGEEDEEGESKKDKLPSQSEIRMLMFSSQKIKVVDIAAAFKALAYKTGYLDEGTVIKKSGMNSVSNEDFINMICGYAAFFTYPSLLKEG